MRHGIGSRQIDRRLHLIDLRIERLELLARRIVFRLRRLLFGLVDLAVVVRVELLDQRDALLIELVELGPLGLISRADLRVGPIQGLRPGDDDGGLGDTDAADLGRSGDGNGGGAKRQRGDGEVAFHQNWVPTLKENSLVWSPFRLSSG